MLRRATILGVRLLGREWRSGELGILLVALTVAVGALTGVSFLVNRISQSVALQANEVLAADLRLESASAALDERYAVEAKNRGLRTARTTSVLSVVFRDNRNQLANLRAVGEGYPLRGVVGVAPQAFGTPTPVDGGPRPGEVWPDSKLLAALDARVGDNASVGAANFRITRVLITRPDQGGGFGELAPSMLMHADDLPSTRLLQPGSRATHALLFAGDRQQIERFKIWLDKKSSAANVCAILPKPARKSRTPSIVRDVFSVSRVSSPCCCARSRSRWLRDATCSDTSTPWRYSKLWVRLAD